MSGRTCGWLWLSLMSFIVVSGLWLGGHLIYAGLNGFTGFMIGAWFWNEARR